MVMNDLYSKGNYLIETIMKKILGTIVTTVCIFIQSNGASAQIMGCPDSQSYNAPAQPRYCPQTHGFVQIGMSENDALSACGIPMKREKSNRAVMKKLPVQQLIYSSTTPANPYPGLNSAYYVQWSIPRGADVMYNLQIDIANDKVVDIKNNGSDGENAMTLCQGNSVQKGNSKSQVIAACGDPDTTNYTCKDVPIPSNSSPEIWTYQVDQYQPPFTLTFIDGVLRCINNC